MKTSFRFTSIIMLIVGVYLTIPRIAEATGAIGTMAARDSNVTSSGSVDIKRESHDLRKVVSTAESNGDYEPPNFGGPDSPHGSGTR